MIRRTLLGIVALITVTLGISLNPLDASAHDGAAHCMVTESGAVTPGKLDITNDYPEVATYHFINAGGPVSTADVPATPNGTVITNTIDYPAMASHYYITWADGFRLPAITARPNAVNLPTACRPGGTPTSVVIGGTTTVVTQAPTSSPTTSNGGSTTTGAPQGSTSPTTACAAAIPSAPPVGCPANGTTTTIDDTPDSAVVTSTATAPPASVTGSVETAVADQTATDVPVTLPRTGGKKSSSFNPFVNPLPWLLLMLGIGLLLVGRKRVAQR